MYLYNFYNPIKFQGHRSTVKVTTVKSSIYAPAVYLGMLSSTQKLF